MHLFHRILDQSKVLIIFTLTQEVLVDTLHHGLEFLKFALGLVQVIRLFDIKFEEISYEFQTK